MSKVDAAKTSLAQVSHQLEIFDKELEGSMMAKNAASSKLAAAEARVRDMAIEITLTEQRLRDWKEKKDKLDAVVGKLHLDIIKAENKLSKKQAYC